jgi:hypothetical protein
MALGQVSEKTRKYYLTITEGKIVHSENGKRELYGYVEGSLERIYQLERTFNGEKVLYWYIDIRGEEGELYSLALPYKSGTFKSIVLALASEPAIGLSTIKIEPYEKGGFTKVVTSSNGKRLDWVTKQLPAVETVSIAGQPVKDDTRRMAYISSLVAQINDTLGNKQ